MREERFLKYNNEKLMKNLLDVEDHLRNISDFETDEGHSSCILKHLLLVESNAEEAISHSSEVNPGSTSTYRRVLEKTSELRDLILAGGTTPDKSILAVRETRKLVEQVAPQYKTSSCKACKLPLDEEKVYISGNLNTIKQTFATTKGSKKNMTEMKDLLYIGGGALLGRGVQEASLYSDTVAPAIIPGVKTSDLVDVVGGAALIIASLKLKVKPEFKLVAAIAGVNILVDKAIDIAKGVTTGGLSSGLSFSSPSVQIMPVNTTAIRGYERALLL